MKRKTAFFTLVLAAAFGAAAAAFTGCTSLLGDYEVAGQVGEGGTAGPGANGAACATGADCSSTFCADGVCCESACSGTCESCGIDKGKCVPVPDNTDPDKECKPEPRPDGGAPPEPDAAVIVDASGDGDATAPDAEAEQQQDGGINLPEAGVTSNDGTCAGSCNGNRACKYPGKELNCGTKFCNTSSQAAAFSCDGKGRCELGVETCKSFTCENDECRKTCAEQNDCQGTHFCNQQGVCQERLADGLGCGNPDQCKSGFCVVEGGSGVCCNSGCSTTEFGPGASCKVGGSVGKCKCSVNCGAGSCRLYYQDFDGDTYGNKDGTPPTTATVGCDNAAPPAGYVADKTDCDDQDNRAHPGQAGYFADTTLGKGLRDFNCDGVISKETREYPGATCYQCPGPVGATCPSGTSVCNSTSYTQTRLTCQLYTDIRQFCFPGQPCPSPYSCGYGFLQSNTAGFTTTVNCGDTSPTFKTCGKCSGATFQPPPSSTVSKQQRCR